MNRYEMIIWWSAEDDAYVVDVPELPGCMAHGPTRQDAIKTAEDAIKFWIKTAKEDDQKSRSPVAGWFMRDCHRRTRFGR